MPTKKPRNPDHVRRRSSPQADNEAKHIASTGLVESSYLRSKCVLPKFGVAMARSARPKGDREFST